MRSPLLRGILATSWLGCFLASGCVMPAKPNASSNEPVATIDGQPIYDADLLPVIRAQMQQLRSQEYHLKTQAVEAVIQKKLLDTEAKTRGLTVEKLLEQEVRSKVSAPAEADIQATYEANKAGLKRPLNEVRDRIIDSLKQAQTQAAQQDYLQRLRTKFAVKILLTAPKIEVTLDPGRLRGNPNAPVTIVEFSDFQCPYCKAAEPTVKQVLAKYGDKVRFSYRDMPLREIHPNAQGAAEASRCAGEQGKYWEYHDLIFSDAAQLDAEGLKARARGAGLDQNRFDSCVASRKFQAQIQEDLDMGVNAGVNGTPGFFINGVSLSGAQPLSAFEQVIDSELKTALNR